MRAPRPLGDPTPFRIPAPSPTLLDGRSNSARAQLHQISVIIERSTYYTHANDKENDKSQASSQPPRTTYSTMTVPVLEPTKASNLSTAKNIHQNNEHDVHLDLCCAIF